MRYVVAYAIVLVVFGACDAVWLAKMQSLLYRPTLGDILLAAPRIGPAIAFYLMFTVGLVVFAVYPAIMSGSIARALALGTLFGAMAYGTYDLTNYATLKNWTLQLTLVDMAWGAIASGIAASAAALVCRVHGS